MRSIPLLLPEIINSFPLKSALSLSAPILMLGWKRFAGSQLPRWEHLTHFDWRALPCNKGQYTRINWLYNCFIFIFETIFLCSTIYFSKGHTMHDDFLVLVSLFVHFVLSLSPA